VHLAQDVTQGAFVALAQNARRLAGHPVLSGWLHRTAQNLAANAVRSEVRRRAREQEAVAMNQLLATEPEASWEAIAPHLDDALGKLNETERDAVLLRYFERKTARDMAEILGISEDAAQKRVNRAIERLRELFLKQHTPVGANSLALLISANAVQSAPAALMKTALAAALAKGATAGVSTLTLIKGALTVMTWKTTASIVAGAIVLLAAGTVVLSEGWLKKPQAVKAGPVAQIMITTAFVTTTVADADAILKDFSKPQVPTNPSSKAFHDLIAQHPRATITLAPRVVTLNGEQATISVTRAVQINGATTNVGVTLDVTPNVESRDVALKFRAELRELTQDTPPAIRLTTVEQAVKFPTGKMLKILRLIPDTVIGQTNGLLIFLLPQIVDARGNLMPQ
jgi:RNA polymerase sigma factor (sigma-70 family)